MSSRRPHRKSRLGCKRCKARKLKCDEVHPVCGNCLKHSMLCDFSPPETPMSLALQPVRIPRLQKHSKLGLHSPSSASPISEPESASRSRSPATTPLEAVDPTPLDVSTPVSSSGSMYKPATNEVTYCPSPVSVGTPADRLFELKLFHHYVTITSRDRVTYLASPEVPGPVSDHWARWTTSLAFGSPSLMDSLLGFSASHLQCLNPSDQEISLASHRYMLRSIVGHAKQLREGINEKNAEAMFATSTFIAFHSSLSRKYLEESGYSPPLHWFRPYQGVKAVFEAGWRWMRNGEVRELIGQDLDYIHSGPGYQPTQLPQLPFTFLLSGLAEEDCDPETMGCYESAVAHLNFIHMSPIRRHAIRFPAILSNRFVELIAAQDPRALTIVGYFFMLLKKVDQVWWLKGTVEREFKAVMAFLPEKWRPRMDWAVREFEAEAILEDLGPTPRLITSGC